MADPKYANLPGIAYDQPDVFETSDLPEVDQVSFDIGDESESVERLALNASEAYTKFKGKGIDSSRTDFSDRISRTRRVGYDAINGEYEMVEDSSAKELPQQKYQRLQHELRELTEEIIAIKAAAKGDADAEKQSAVVTATQVEQLEKQLLELQLEKVLGSEVIANLADPQGSLQKQLLTQVENLKVASVAETGKRAAQSGGASASGDQIIYELHYKPEHVKFQQTAKVAEFEQRLAKLENVIGKDFDKMATLASDTNQKSLLGAISVLSAKTCLLDPEQLEQVEGRLNILNQKLAQASDKRVAVEDADKLNKVTEVYNIVKKMESLSGNLPTIVERLVALRDLHEQALQFSKALTQLDVTQQQIHSGLQDNNQVLKEVQEQLGKNMNAVKSNLSSLDKRITALKKP